jgi:GNAT superfamily N-acetyltransferase
MGARSLSDSDRLEISTWDYSPELDRFSREEIANKNGAFFAVYSADGKIFLGFGVTGQDAMVQGEELNPTDLDVGFAMDPELIGTGRGKEFGKAVLVHATYLAKKRGHDHLRCAIHSENAFTHKLATTTGFEQTNAIVNSLGKFNILRKAIE